MSQLLRHFEGATPGPGACDVEGMRTPILTAIATLSLAGTALAATPPAPTPVSDEVLNRPVSIDVSIHDAGGTTVDSLACDWATGGPGDDDRPCLRFQSDPQVAFAAIEDGGGVRAEQRTVTDVSDMRIAYSKRADGTWLIRARGTVEGSPRHFGRVCTADGQSCVRWDAEGARAARKDVRAAAAKLKRRR